jgi:hypothetical protein
VNSRRDQFRIAQPELLSDADQPILPRRFVALQFETRDNVAQLMIELPRDVRMRAYVHFGQDRIKAQVSAANPFETRMENVQRFHMLRLSQGPSFHDPAATRTYFPVNGKPASVSELLCQRSSRRACITKLCVRFLQRTKIGFAA